MRQRNPDNRFRYVASCIGRGEVPEYPIEKALFDYLSTGTTDHVDVNYAREIAENQYEKEILNAFLLSGATDEQLFEHLKIPVKVVATYRHLYFDVTQFRDELDIFSWVREQEVQKGSGTYEVELLRQAVLGGVEAMLWIYSRNSQGLDPKEVLENILADAYFRSKMNRSAPITSKIAKEAHTYMNTAIKAGDLLVKHNLTQNQVSNTSDMMLKLGHRELTHSFTEIPNKDDLLH